MPYGRLYVVTRADLSPGQQAVQAVHAALRFSWLHRGHYLLGGTVVLLAVPDETALRELHAQVLRHDHSAFTEPDLGDALTAVVVAEDGRHLVTHLPLALREEVRCNGR